MKIVHLITDLGFGGAEATLARLVTRMDRERFQNIVISLTDRGTHGDAIEAAGIPLFTLDMRKTGRLVFWQPGAAVRLWRLLRAQSPDVLQTWLYHADLLGLFVGRYAGIRKIAWNIRCSDLDISKYSYRSALVFGLLKAYSHYVNVVVTNSEAARRVHLERGYAPPEWRIIPNGFDLKAFAPDPAFRREARRRWGVDDGAFVVGMVARFDPHKAHDVFMAAAERFARHAPEARFVLVGPDMTVANRAMVAMIRARGLGDRVVLAGISAQVERVYPAFDIATLSSRSESFPNVIAEAMAAGIPCAATDVGDTAVVVGDAGLVVPRNDPEALAEAWLSLYRMGPEARRALGRRARVRIEQEFSVDGFVRRYEEFYERLSGRPVPARGSRVADPAAAVTP